MTRIRSFISPPILLYTILSIILTWPLVGNIMTRVPGMAQWAFDESTFIWNIWYFKHALVDNLSSPLHSELIWFPLGIDLILYTYNFFHALMAQPLFLAVNLPFASNVILLLSTILSGYGTYLLVLYLGAKLPSYQPKSAMTLRYAAFAAGLLYAFASNRAIYAALGHYDMVTTQWIPFYALCLLRSVDTSLSVRQRGKSAVLAGIFFAFNGLAEMITAVFLAIFTVIVVIGLISKSISFRVTNQSKDSQPPNTTILSLITGLVIMGLIAFILWSPALLPILNQFVTNDFSLKGWGEAIPLSTDLLGWFTPSVLHPLFGEDLISELRRVQLRALEDATTNTGFRDVNTVFLGWVSVLLAVIGVIVYRQRVRIWTWTAILFGLFTLGPFIQINGQYRFDLDGVEATFPMPYALLHYIPIIKANRAPNRNSVLLMLGLAILLGYGLYWLLTKVKVRNVRLAATLQTSMVILFGGLIIFEHLTIPLPLSDARIPAVYEEIAADPAPVSVMHLPLGWRNSFGVLGPERTQLQYFQTGHGKPMIGGNISRAPDFKMDYFERIPYFKALTDIQFGHPVAPEILAQAEAQAGELMALYNTKYVLFYPPIEQRFPYADHWQKGWDFAKSTLPLEPEPFWTGEGVEAYRVVQPDLAFPVVIDLGTTGTYPYRGEGWDAVEVDTPYEATAVWVTDKQSRLFVPLRNTDTRSLYTVGIHVHPFAYPGSPQQSVALQVNGEMLETRLLGNEWQEVTWQVPSTFMNNGLNRLVLHWDYAATPRTVIGGNRQVGQTGRELTIDADLKAFEGGGFIALFDEDGEQTNGSAGRRGVNVTVLDDAGKIVEMRGFDTAANTYESDNLAEFLAGIDNGQFVMVVSSGNATAFLTEGAVEGLRSIGADVTMDSIRGQYFAIVGIQGADAGQAAMMTDAQDAFLRISLNRDRRSLAAAVDWVRLE